MIQLRKAGPVQPLQLRQSRLQLVPRRGGDQNGGMDLAAACCGAGNADLTIRPLCVPLIMADTVTVNILEQFNEAGE